MNIWIYERVVAGHAGRKIVRSVPLERWGIRRDMGELLGEENPNRTI